MNNNRNLFNQIIKFLIVGGISTVIDWTVYYILYNFFGISPLVANILSFSISLIYNYMASVKWVFNVSKNKSKKRVFIEFVSLSLIGLLLSELILYLFINILSFGKMVSKIIANSLVMVFNFITRKLYIEK